MSIDKVFEALEILSRALEFNDEGEFQSGRLWRIIFNDMVDDKDKSIIEQALTELQQIKEANPSEAFKCLNKIVESFNETSTGMYGLGEVVVANDLIYGFKEELETIKNYILKAQDLEKVLNDIIKHLSFEGSGVEVVKDFINDKEETKYIIKVTSKDTGATIHIRLDTEEESKLLKRYFDNENNK